MFCINCGFRLPDTARFCSSCGTSVASPTSSQGTPTTSQASPIPAPTSPPAYSSPVSVASPVSPSSTALFDPLGNPLPAFSRLAGALFNALDQNVPPQRSGGLEVAKMTAFRTMGGLTVPPFYGEHVLPTYASVVGIDLIPNQPSNAPVVSWNGWHQFLTQKIRLEPDASFMQISRVCAALRVPGVVLSRSDFPAGPDPMAQAKENQFKTQIYALARSGLGAGALGGGLGAGFGGGFGGAGGAGAGGSGSSAVSLATAQAMAKLAVQGGISMMNSSAPAGSGYWYMPGS